MKNANLIYSIGAIVIIIGALLKVLHLPYGKIISEYSFIAGLLIQTWYVFQLKKRIKDLESKAAVQ